MRHARLAATLVLAALLLSACGASGARSDAPVRKPKNVSAGPETLLPAPASAVEDTPDWTELPPPVASAFGAALDRGRFQAFAAMKQSTVSVRLKAAPTDRDVFRALDAAYPFLAEEYSLVLNIYAPGEGGKDRYRGYEWTPLSGTLVRKGSADADQGWDAAITAVTEGSAGEMQPEAVKRIAEGQAQPPLFQ